MNAKQLVSCLCTALLTISLLPPQALAELASGEARDQAYVLDAEEAAKASIEELLAAGDYVEGEAIAVVRAGADTEAVAEAEELATASAESVELAAGEPTGSDVVTDELVALRAQSVDADEYSIRMVVDHDRTTEDILAELYADPNVVSAEPNYLIEGPWDLEDEEVEVGEAQEEPSLSDEQGEPDAEVPQVEPVEDELPSEPDEAEAPEAFEPEESQELVAPEEQEEAKDPEESEGQDPAKSEDVVIEAQDAAPNPSDLSGLQWSLDKNMSTFITPKSPSDGYGMNIPGWLEGHNNPTADENASGTVCIMDTGIDPTHPDLQGVLFDFEEELPAERYAELKAQYGLGRYGINATSDTTPDDFRAYNEHGVHVAGIAAAQWDGVGTSGIANGVKVFAARVFFRPAK